MAAAVSAFDENDLERARDLWTTLKDKYGEFEATGSMARLYISICDRLLNWESYSSHLGRYSDPAAGPLRVCIYSANVGSYDSVKLPGVVNQTVSYVLFSDADMSRVGPFEVRPIPYHASDPTRAARYIKLHPHHLLPDFDIAIWIDSNIMIVDRIDDLVRDFLQSGKPVGAIRHPLRQTLEEEVEACTFRNKDDAEIMGAQLRTYQAAGFSTRSLIESNFMMFDLRRPETRLFLDIWWAEICKFSRRDQLSINFALNEANITPHFLIKRPGTARDNARFALVPHDSGQGPAQRLIDKFPVSPQQTRANFRVAKAGILGKLASENVDVVVCVRDALEDVAACLESVMKHRASKERLIIVDDGSEAQTAEFLVNFAKGRSEIVLIRHDTPLGYTKAANAGLRKSSAPFVVLLNSDTVVTRNWTAKLRLVAEQNPGVGIVGPMSNAASHQSLPNIDGTKGQTAINGLPPGHSADDMNALCEEWADVALVPRVPLVHGFCFGITRETIDRIGYFDEDAFPNGYGEENDYCMRAENAGIGLAVATHTYIYHAKSKSYSDDERRARLMKEGSKVFRGRHGDGRVRRSVEAMQANPEFIRLRELAARLYE